MDKYEFKLKVDEMKALVNARNYKAAAEIAETINWRKIRNLNALVLAGEVFEQVERYEDSKEILLMAYDKSPIGRNIIYRLAEIAIKTKNFEDAKDYYNEFVDIAPHDNLKFVLKYKMTAAQGLPYQEQIKILEELKEQEYSEEWAYELAYLYHRAGQPDKCVEACDELILWFGDGIYVEKALELKMNYQPLTKPQEEKYRLFRQKRAGVIEVKPEDFLESGEIVNEAMQIPSVVTTAEKYNTANLQNEIAKGLKQIIDSTPKENAADVSGIQKMAEENPYFSLPEENTKQDILNGRNTERISGGGTGRAVSFGRKFNPSEQRHTELVEEPRKKMTIQEIQEEWEKTKRAMQDVLDEAEESKVESAKARALHQAENLVEQLKDIIPQLTSGMTGKASGQEYLPSAEVQENIDEACRIVAGMNKLLQDQIDFLTTGKVSSQNAHKVSDPTRELPELPPDISTDEQTFSDTIAAGEAVNFQKLEQFEKAAANQDRKINPEKERARSGKEGIAEGKEIKTEKEMKIEAESEIERKFGDIPKSGEGVETEWKFMEGLEGKTGMETGQKFMEGSERNINTGIQQEMTLQKSHASRQKQMGNTQLKAGESTQQRSQAAVQRQEMQADAELNMQRKSKVSRQEREVQPQTARESVRQEARPAVQKRQVQPQTAAREPMQREQRPAVQKREVQPQTAVKEPMRQKPQPAVQMQEMQPQTTVKEPMRQEQRPAVQRQKVQPQAAELPETANMPDNRTLRGTRVNAKKIRISLSKKPKFKTQEQLQNVTAVENAQPVLDHSFEEQPYVQEKTVSAAAQQSNDSLITERKQIQKSDMLKRPVAEREEQPADEEQEEISEEDMAAAAYEAGFYEDVPLSQENNIIKSPVKDTAKKSVEESVEDILADESYKKLTPEQQEVFSYFVPISGLEAQIYDLLQGVSRHLQWDQHSLSGNIIIEGISGSGKTVLIMDIIKVLQKECQRPNGKIGKIDANALNQKDIDKLIEKISGGCLIIESAGKISRETAVKLSLHMEKEHSGTLFILEDTQEGIQKALERDSSFASKFTEKISIPIFTSDDLVLFGKAYANDLDYDIDEMGILALYKRINNIQKLDHATTLTEVKEIVDEAIDKAESGALKKVFGILTATRYNDDNYVILREKDFEE